MSFADLKRNLLAPALVRGLGEPVTHAPKVGDEQTEGLMLIFHDRTQLDEAGERWKYATGQASDFDQLPVKRDVITRTDTGESFVVDRCVDNDGVLEFRLEGA